MLPSVFARGNSRTLENLTNLRKQAITDKAPKVALRLSGIMLSLEKHRVNEIARLLHVHRSTVHSWIYNWNEYREQGLLEGYRSGRPNRLNELDRQRLADIVDSGPIAYGLNTGVWTSPIIAQVIEEEFEISYHPGHVRKMLKEIGFSVQRPTTKLVQADQQQRNKWIRYTYPNLKKKPTKKKR
jgi:transposase